MKTVERLGRDGPRRPLARRAGRDQARGAARGLQRRARRVRRSSSAPTASTRACLLIPLVGFLPATDPARRRHGRAIQRGSHRATASSSATGRTTENVRRRRPAAGRGRLPPVLLLARSGAAPAGSSRRGGRAVRAPARAAQRPRPDLGGVRPRARPASSATSRRRSRTSASSRPRSPCHAGRSADGDARRDGAPLTRRASRQGDRIGVTPWGARDVSTDRESRRRTRPRARREPRGAGRRGPCMLVRTPGRTRGARAQRRRLRRHAREPARVRPERRARVRGRARAEGLDRRVRHGGHSREQRRVRHRTARWRPGRPRASTARAAPGTGALQPVRAERAARSRSAAACAERTRTGRADRRRRVRRRPPAALDARGRTLAYGRGGGRSGLVSVCPGGGALAELAYTRYRGPSS